ncbi:MBL fold metallo-hydrolase [Caulobacter sp. D5]|uniref:MBL fold metallo-hydrolase n=1 Tax=Caulobacter sp. D5 TaxID=357400 RepID=UPI0011B511D8|nr:MBL fold metallo-hydrolase [Caulobacter sp. D5]
MTDHRAKVRMYRHGLGDCLLVRLARDGDRDFNILIDCGVILGTKDARAKINAVMENVVAETGNVIDLLVLTHAHGDHVSGFLQAEAIFRKLEVGQVWMAWTEDPDDSFAKSLLDARGRRGAVDALQAVAGQMQAAGDAAAGEKIAGLMDFFGIDDVPFGAAGGRATTEDAVQVARELAPEGKLLYCKPGQDPYRPPGAKARIMVLGPPRDHDLIRKSTPSKKAPETFDMAFDAPAGGPPPGIEGRPFSPLFTIPLDVARAEVKFFQDNYWNQAGASGWRGIDDVGSSALDFAIKLDNDTNNTSLVLAIELDGPGDGGGDAGRDVLLFAADAQVGNWLSWKDVKWTRPEGEASDVEGLDLVRRTIVYKVGHHGSHNATLKDYLLSMERLRIALNPVDEVMAGKKHWDHIPLPSLEEALRKQAKEALVRADENGVKGDDIVEDPLFYEVTV